MPEYAQREAAVTLPVRIVRKPRTDVTYVFDLQHFLAENNYSALNSDTGPYFRGIDDVTRTLHEHVSPTPTLWLGPNTKAISRAGPEKARPIEFRGLYPGWAQPVSAESYYPRLHLIVKEVSASQSEDEITAHITVGIHIDRAEHTADMSDNDLEQCIRVARDLRDRITRAPDSVVFDLAA